MNILSDIGRALSVRGARVGITLAVVVLCGCRASDMQGGDGGGDGRIEIRISPGIQQSWGETGSGGVASRAFLTGTQFPWASGNPGVSGGWASEFGLFVRLPDGSALANAAAGWNNIRMQSIRYSQWSEPEQAFYWKNVANAPREYTLTYTGISKVKLYSYYPYNKGLDNSSSQKAVPFDLRNVGPTDTIDFLYCEPIELTASGSGNQKVDMNYKHAFALMEFSVKARDMGSIVPKVTSVSISDGEYVISDGMVNIESGEVSGSKGISKHIFESGNVLKTDTYTQFSILTAPLTVPVGYSPDYAAGKGIRVVFTLEGGMAVMFNVKKEHLSGGVSLDAGKRYSFKLILDGTSYVKLELESWVVPGDISGEAGGGKPKSIVIDGLKWATGNLVADASVTPGSGVGANTNGTKVKIGKPTDGGLYFQFGSLIGYKGGNVASGGTGRGIPHGTTTTDIMPDTKYWNQAAAYSWANDAMVWPQTYTNGATAWPQNLATNSYYFGLSSYATSKAKLSAFPGWQDGTLVAAGVAVGDPCRYYLGGGWRTPTTEEIVKLLNNQTANSAPGSTTKTYNAGMTDSRSPTEGIGLYANTTATTEAAAKADPNALFFPASGYRNTSNGSFNNVGRYGYSWSGSVYSATTGFSLAFYTTGVNPQGNSSRSNGFPVRCVSSVALSSDKADNTAPAEAGNILVTVSGAAGEGWTLVENSDTQSGFSAPPAGFGDGTFTVAVTANTGAAREASYTLSTASGLTATITLKQDEFIPPSILINGLLWATGNLVADASVTPGSGVATGTNGTKVKIGKPTDGGLYFQFGSLIGYKGGNTASGGRGTGIPHGATTTDPMPNDKYWSQATAYSWANDAMVWPQAYTSTAATWPTNKITNDYYFGLGTAPYSSAGQKLSDYLTWESGGLVNQSIAVGDPCRYYLGGAWRMPTAEDWGKLFNSKYANSTVGGTWPGAGQNWGYGTATKTVMAGIPSSSNSATEGVGIYANTTATTEAAAKADPGALFFPASGYRFTSNGSFYYVGRNGYCWSGSVYNATHGFYLYFTTTDVYPQNSNLRSYGYPVRCVSAP